HPLTGSQTVGSGTAFTVAPNSTPCRSVAAIAFIFESEGGSHVLANHRNCIWSHVVGRLRRPRCAIAVNRESSGEPRCARSAARAAVAYALRHRIGRDNLARDRTHASDAA